MTRGGLIGPAESYDEAPRPLTDEERRLLKRMFSDYFEVPPEWKASLRADLERDPPILGKITLGSVGQAQVPLGALASGGEIGDSGVSLSLNAITLGGDVVLVRQNSGVFDMLVSTIRMGATSDIVLQRASSDQLNMLFNNLRIGTAAPVRIGVSGGGQLIFYTDEILFGFTAQDVRITRYGIDAIQLSDKILMTYNEGPGYTPLYLNHNGTVYQVKVGTGGALFI